MSKYLAAIFIVPAAILLAGCTESPGSTAPREESARKALRVKDDIPRGRHWELEWGGVSVYDVATRRLIRRIPLPGASLSAARETCLPDLVLSRSGAAIISSNAQARLWRIGPERFEVEVHDVAVDSDKDKDFGFSALAWDAQERMLYAASAVTGTSWRIDLESDTASRVASSSEPSPGAPAARGECRPAPPPEAAPS